MILDDLHIFSKNEIDAYNLILQCEIINADIAVYEPIK